MRRICQNNGLNVWMVSSVYFVQTDVYNTATEYIYLYASCFAHAVGKQPEFMTTVIKFSAN